MTDVIALPPEAEKKMYEYGGLSAQAQKAGDMVAAEKYFLAAWGCIPEPKLAYDHAQSMTVGLAEFFRDIGQPAKAMQWLPLAQQAYGPGSNPTTEFLAATIHYQAGELDAAYQLFDSLFKQYKRRPFQGEKPEYLAFYLDRTQAQKKTS